MVYQDIEAEALHTLLEDGKLLLVDVRNDDEVAKGVIANAIHIPLGLLPVNIDKLGEAIPLVFYCHSGIRSAQACAYLAGKGRNHLFNLRGGVLAWGRAGLPFDTLKK